jgi:pimeloyl-ACP methyl ester carboxylesterase
MVVPVFERGKVHIHYEDHGEGDPVLLIAPGGMHSRIGAWEKAPWNPITALRATHRVIAMDQRNAGRSYAPVAATDGWTTYTEDQLALLDHLGIDRFAVVGMCIGGPYIIGLAKAAPRRVTAAVLLQPIGLEDNRAAFFELFDGWKEAIASRHPEADPDTWASFRDNMFGGDFMFGASREDVAGCRVPLLVLMGSDRYHPSSVSRAVAELAPEARLIERWKAPDEVEAADEAIRAFLATHRPSNSTTTGAR